MRRCVVWFATLVLLATACAPQDGVTVELDEYTLRVRPSSEVAGEITFRAQNVGAIAHQLLILRTRHAVTRLPVEKGVVPVDAKGIEVLGEIEIVVEGRTEELTIDLDRGRYVLICNIAGHYDNGMRATLTVDG